MTKKKTAVLLIGFGGPRNLEEVRPFLASIVDGAKIPEARLQDVYHHYEVIGGKSYFNEITEKQQKALRDLLRSQGHDMPVGVAYRHSTPNFTDAFEQFKKLGVEHVIGFVLASFRSFVSQEWYHEKVAHGRKQAEAENITVEYTRPFDADPLYVQAQAERVKETWVGWSDADKQATQLVFTAHSIPSTMCESSCGQNQDRCYGYQFSRASRAVAKTLQHSQMTVCYQSRSGNPRDPWLDPDVNDKIRSLDRAKIKKVLLVPVGFLCDNVEVVYDLDHQAKKTSEDLGLQYHRAGTVSTHPLFIEMMAQRVLEKIPHA